TGSSLPPQARTNAPPRTIDDHRRIVRSYTATRSASRFRALYSWSARSSAPISFVGWGPDPNQPVSRLLVGAPTPTSPSLVCWLGPRPQPARLSFVGWGPDPNQPVSRLLVGPRPQPAVTARAMYACPDASTDRSPTPSVISERKPFKLLCGQTPPIGARAGSTRASTSP